jgi:cytochrome c-type biogenesis protein CcmH
VAPAQVRVRVELAPDVAAQVQPEDSVFIFARPAAGEAMPLAVKRLTVADLPAEVLLSDADAMMEQLRLSNFPQIELVARVSRSGNATVGEWIGRSGAVSSADEQVQTLRIDQPEKR